ncbi:hypothetical protein M0804_010199 [Polistes exclamans]|nr:hypothetical protein M0804_010199 [Polistes exclamans]
MIRTEIVDLLIYLLTYFVAWWLVAGLLLTCLLACLLVCWLVWWLACLLVCFEDLEEETGSPSESKETRVGMVRGTMKEEETSIHPNVTPRPSSHESPTCFRNLYSSSNG